MNKAKMNSDRLREKRKIYGTYAAVSVTYIERFIRVRYQTPTSSGWMQGEYSLLLKLACLSTHLASFICFVLHILQAFWVTLYNTASTNERVSLY